jgi:hypothetical protein
LSSVSVVCVVEVESRNQNDKCGFPIRRGAIRADSAPKDTVSSSCLQQ